MLGWFIMSPGIDQNAVYYDFKERLTRNPAGWYETNLPWKANHPDLLTNEAASRRHLTTLLTKLKRDGNYEQYNGIIHEQLEQEIMEAAPNEPVDKEHFTFHTRRS